MNWIFTFELYLYVILLNVNCVFNSKENEKHGMQIFTGDTEINTRKPFKTEMHLKDTNYSFTTDKNEREINIMTHESSILLHAPNSSNVDEEQETRRSCIKCNNVKSEDCNDPKNKLIQSVLCEHEDDTCYTMHTPFGIIDRGCFNSNRNLTTYVCSSNLCNYIPLSEMPYMFSNKHDWVDNVIDISRTRNFRKSVFKAMSCLSCEVNTAKQQDAIRESVNCLAGHIENVPVEECDQNEVCAIKAIKANGYIWRGCIEFPLYNYLWTLCEFDLCNYDSIISLYDFI